VLTEVAVIRAVHEHEHLAAGGWQIVSQAAPDRHGTDLVAVRDGTRLEAEAQSRTQPGTASPSQQPR
jgi:hypothetical protein